MHKKCGAEQITRGNVKQCHAWLIVGMRALSMFPFHCYLWNSLVKNGHFWLRVKERENKIEFYVISFYSFKKGKIDLSKRNVIAQSKNDINKILQIKDAGLDYQWWLLHTAGSICGLSECTLCEFNNNKHKEMFCIKCVQDLHVSKPVLKLSVERNFYSEGQQAGFLNTK